MRSPHCSPNAAALPRFTFPVRRSRIRGSREPLGTARTDAIAVDGFEHAVGRAALYRDAGADVLFVGAPQTRAELERIRPALGSARLMANMVEGGKPPPLAAAELEAMG